MEIFLKKSHHCGKKDSYSITIAGLNGSAVSALTWPLPSASTIWTGTTDASPISYTVVGGTPGYLVIRGVGVGPPLETTALPSPAVQFAILAGFSMLIVFPVYANIAPPLSRASQRIMREEPSIAIMFPIPSMVCAKIAPPSDALQPVIVEDPASVMLPPPLVKIAPPPGAEQLTMVEDSVIATLLPLS